MNGAALRSHSLSEEQEVDQRSHFGKGSQGGVTVRPKLLPPWGLVDWLAEVDRLRIEKVVLTKS